MDTSDHNPADYRRHGITVRDARTVAMELLAYHDRTAHGASLVKLQRTYGFNRKELRRILGEAY